MVQALSAAVRVPVWLDASWHAVAVKEPTGPVPVWEWTVSRAQRDELLAARDAGLVVTMQRKEPDGVFTLLAAAPPKSPRGSPHYEFGFASRAGDLPREAPAAVPPAPAGAGDVQTPAPVEGREIKRKGGPRNLDRWSDARRDVVSRMYPADVPGQVILRHLHALPGEAVTLGQLNSFAGYRGLRRPVANEGGSMPVSRASVEVYADAMQVVFDGKSLRDVNLCRRDSKRPPFFVPAGGR